MNKLLLIALLAVLAVSASAYEYIEEDLGSAQDEFNYPSPYSILSCSTNRVRVAATLVCSITPIDRNNQSTVASIRDFQIEVLNGHWDYLDTTDLNKAYTNITFWVRVPPSIYRNNDFTTAYTKTRVRAFARSGRSTVAQVDGSPKYVNLCGIPTPQSGIVCPLDILHYGDNMQCLVSNIDKNGHPTTAFGSDYHLSPANGKTSRLSALDGRTQLQFTYTAPEFGEDDKIRIRLTGKVPTNPNVDLEDSPVRMRLVDWPSNASLLVVPRTILRQSASMQFTVLPVNKNGVRSTCLPSDVVVTAVNGFVSELTTNDDGHTIIGTYTSSDAALSDTLTLSLAIDGERCMTQTLTLIGPPSVNSFMTADNTDYVHLNDGTSNVILTFLDEHSQPSPAVLEDFTITASHGTVDDLRTEDNGYTWQGKYHAPPASAGVYADEISASTVAGPLSSGPIKITLVGTPSTQSSVYCLHDGLVRLGTELECVIKVRDHTGSPIQSLLTDFSVTSEYGDFAHFASADGGESWTFTFTPVRSVSVAHVDAVVVNLRGRSVPITNSPVSLQLVGSPSYFSPFSCETNWARLDGGNTTCTITVMNEADVPTTSLASDFNVTAEIGEISAFSTKDHGMTWTFTYTAPAQKIHEWNDNIHVALVPADEDEEQQELENSPVPLFLVGNPDVVSVVTCTDMRLRQGAVGKCNITAVDRYGAPTTSAAEDFDVTSTYGTVSDLHSAEEGFIWHFEYKAPILNQTLGIWTDALVIKATDERKGPVIHSPYPVHLYKLPNYKSVLTCSATSVYYSHKVKCLITSMNKFGPIHAKKRDFDIDSSSGRITQIATKNWGGTYSFNFLAPSSLSGETEAYVTVELPRFMRHIENSPLRITLLAFTNKNQQNDQENQQEEVKVAAPKHKKH